MSEQDAKDRRLAVVGLALMTLDAACNGDRDEVNESFSPIIEMGSDAIILAMVTWCIAYQEYSVGGPGCCTAPVARLLFVDNETGEALDVDKDIAPQWAWAGRLLSAHGSHDKETFLALIYSLPNAMDEALRYVDALLDCIAEAFNKLPPGFAVDPDFDPAAAVGGRRD